MVRARRRCHSLEGGADLRMRDASAFSLQLRQQEDNPMKAIDFDEEDNPMNAIQRRRVNAFQCETFPTWYTGG